MITYKTLTSQEIEKVAKNIPTTLTTNGSIFDGFTIFSKETIKNGHGKKVFFSCFDNDKLVGVLKFTRVDRYSQNLWSIVIVDVHKNYRRQGIAKGLHELVNAYATNDMIIVWTNLTREGQAAKINKMGMNIITKCDTLENMAHFEEAYGYADLG